jgi:drug/metabolite transporter (DMT)-like permease
MLYLFLSIVCATYLVVCFRYFDKWKIDPTFAIVYNYIFCVLTGLFFVDDFSMFCEIPAWDGLPYATALGFVFYLIFILVGKNTLISGVVSTSISMKLSFVIPVTLAVFLYGDNITWFKILGILFAIAAVFLIAYERADNGLSATSKFKWLYPILIFIGCGLCDSTFNYIQKKHTLPGWDHLITIYVFISATALGWLLNFYKKGIFQWKNVGAGIMMGIPNYFSLYFLLKTLSTLPWQSSVIFPINNLGIVCLSAFVGFVLFKETFNVRKLAGFMLAVASITLIGFGEQIRVILSGVSGN